MDAEGATMLEESNQEAPAASLPAAPRAVPAPSGVEELVGKLRACRVRPRLLAANGGWSAGGAGLRIPVQAALRSPPGGGRLMRRIAMLLHENLRITLSLTDLGPEGEAVDALENFCNLLSAAVREEGLATDGIGISMQSHLVPLRAYLVICAGALGRGDRYVILDSLQMRHHDDHVIQAEAEANWSFLWCRREAAPALVPAYAASVTTRCPLLGDEAATTILPECGLQVPVESAWLPLEIDLLDFSDGRGRIQWQPLQAALEAAVDLGERILEHLRWPLPQQRNDAWQNRRLAVIVHGIGDLVVERAADPADLECLQWLDAAVARVHALLWNRSKMLARRAEPLPALLSACPSVPWNCDIKKSDWDTRWRRAVASSAVRHRNLLVMSPYSVLPRSGDAGAAFADLLPVLHHADAFSFAAPRVQGFRNCAEFSNFHRRAWAVMQRRNAASLVAAGV